MWELRLTIYMYGWMYVCICVERLELYWRERSVYQRRFWAAACTRRETFELGLMSLADQSPCTSWLAQYERTEACRAALALVVSGWPASRSAVAPRLTPSIKQIAQQSGVSLRTRDDMARSVAFGLTRPPRVEATEDCVPWQPSSEQSHAPGRRKLQLRGAGKVCAQRKKRRWNSLK